MVWVTKLQFTEVNVTVFPLKMSLFIDLLKMMRLLLCKLFSHSCAHFASVRM